MVGAQCTITSRKPQYGIYGDGAFSYGIIFAVSCISISTSPAGASVGARKRIGIAVLALLGAVGFLAHGGVVLENARFVLTIGSDCAAESLVLKANGEEMLASGERMPLFSVTQDRFFHNEIKLAYPSGEVTCFANRVSREGDTLRIGFELLPYDALVRVVGSDDSISFELAGFSPHGTAYSGYKGKMPPVKSFRVMQLPVKPRKNFGEWLNVMWDEHAAVAVLAPDPFMHIGAERRGGFRIFSADLDRDMKLEGGKAVLMAAAGKDDFLRCLDAMEASYGLPRGVRDRQSDVFNSSVFWTADVTPENVDEQIAYARRGGFRMMLIYHTAICKSPGDYLNGDIGDYEMRDEYPKGLESLREMLSKIKAAGIRPGLHLLHPFIGFNSRKYVTPVADHRLHIKKHFTVAKDMGVRGGDLYVEENPSSCPLVAEARLLRFEGELLSYEGFTTERPYMFTGVKRGAKGTRVVPLPVGRIGGLLDVAEDGGNSCYVDQDSSLQDELCDRFAEFWSCGFEFLCLDGCEGVNAPCQAHVANGQYRVWKKLDPKPLFTEGAAKAHFAWHHLSGANAFDTFSPEMFKSMIVKWPLREAEEIAKDFSRVSFGWWGIWLPGEKLTAGGRRKAGITVGTQPDMWEFGTSRAAAWDSPTTIQFSWDNLAKVKGHPRMDDLFEVMRRWEDVRARKWLTPEQKAALKSPTRQHHLYIGENGEYELYEIEMLVPEDAAGLRAFLFERKGRRVIAYWHTSGSGEYELPLGAGGENVTLRAGGMQYYVTTLSRADVLRAFGR